MIDVTLRSARGLALAAQRLLAPPVWPAAKATLLELIDDLGVVQIDTINVVARTQYLVLWSRLGPYDPAWLDELLYPDRALFEYWAHAASLLPVAHYRYYRAAMLAYGQNGWSRHNRLWLEEHAALTEDILAAIRARGALPSSAFDTPREGGTGPWASWYGKESRRALEVLWTMGRLMVDRRRGGQKVYDLAERVLPAGADDAVLPTPRERDQFFARRAACALGVTTPSWLADYFRRRWTRAESRALLEGLADEGLVVRARVEDLAEPAYVSADLVPLAGDLRDGRVVPTRTTLLSPFDNLIWHRARATALFGFTYVFEAYVPSHRRQYGYYSLAVLHRGDLLGHLDAKTDRAARRLLLRGLHLTPAADGVNGLAPALAMTLRDLASFLGLTSVQVVEGRFPGYAGRVRDELQHLLAA